MMLFSVILHFLLLKIRYLWNYLVIELKMSEKNKKTFSFILFTYVAVFFFCASPLRLKDMYSFTLIIRIDIFVHFFSCWAELCED